MARCLIVDDSSVIRKVAKRILADSDMMVTDAGSGFEAIERSSHDMADVVIVDGSLPDMDSIELIRRLMSMPSDIRPHILLCLAELDLGAIMRAKRAGARGYMLKPFTRAQLLEQLRDLSLAA